MSENIYNKAKFYVDKVLYIFAGLDKCKQQLEQRSCQYYVKYKFNKNSFSYRYDRFQSFRVLAQRNDSRGFFKSSNNYWIDHSGTNSMPGFDRAFMEIHEFTEDVDFMLSTLFDDKELYHYYVGSLLYTAGFRGFVQKDISHNTLNALIRHVDDMYVSRDKLWYTPKTSPTFNF